MDRSLSSPRIASSSMRFLPFPWPSGCVSIYRLSISLRYIYPLRPGRVNLQDRGRMAAGGQGEGGGEHPRDATADPQDVGAELVGEGTDGGTDHGPEGEHHAEGGLVAPPAVLGRALGDERARHRGGDDLAERPYDHH